MLAYLHVWNDGSKKECLDVVVAWDDHYTDEFDVLTNDVQRVGDADATQRYVRETDSTT